MTALINRMLILFCIFIFRKNVKFLYIYYALLYSALPRCIDFLSMRTFRKSLFVCFKQQPEFYIAMCSYYYDNTGGNNDHVTDNDDA